MDCPLFTWPSLTRATLIRRYKRFLADVTLPDGSTATVHCPNSGRMTACAEPGCPVYLSRSDNPRRKHPFTWEMAEMPSSLVVVNTLRANEVTSAAVSRGLIPELAGYETLRREVPYGANSRVDLLLESPHQPPCFVEVKSCTLTESSVAMFPDAPTVRGQKHLAELSSIARQGSRAVMFFAVLRMDGSRFIPARHIDPAYAEALALAVDCGVEILVYRFRLSRTGIHLDQALPWSLH